MEELVLENSRLTALSGSLQSVCSQLLSSGKIHLIIGYKNGSEQRVKPAFARTEAEIGMLVFDERCTFNLAVFLYKKELKPFGRPAVVANVNTLRSILRLAAENQLREEELVAIIQTENGEFLTLDTLASIETYLKSKQLDISPADREMIARLDAMTAAERWAFWQKELAKCTKCYACRQACPLCYCTTCTVELNQPQWISVPANKLGNIEWHVMRTMHLAGRCTTCGQCGAVCPMNIPLHLLPIKLAEEMKSMFGTVSGVSRTEDCALSTFRPDDKENFIG